MVRAVFFLLAVALLAWLAAFLGGLDGVLDAEVNGVVIGVHTGLAIGLTLILVAIVFISAFGFKSLIDWPGKIRRKAFEARRAKGMLSLTRGLEAVAAGDATDATRLAKAASRQLEEPALTRLLTAQAAQLSGDEGTARDAFTAMLAAPETEFLGRRGLYLQAMRANDATAAAEHAERAFRLRPNAEWAFRSVFDLALERAAWGEARAALELAQKNHVVEGEDVRRSKAALLAADAYAANAAGDSATALREAEEAAKLAPDFAPAAVLAARRLAATGKTGRAEKVLEAAWKERPHPAIAVAYADLKPRDDANARAERLSRLADLSPFEEESILLRAEQNIVLEDWAAAREGLEQILTRRPTARAFSLMAAAVEGETGSASAARPFYSRAATAPRETGLGLDGDFDLSAATWTRLVREYAEHGRLEPPALADAPRGLTPDEIRRLAPAPVAMPEPETDETGDVETNDIIDVDSIEPGEAASSEAGAIATPLVSAEPVGDAKADAPDTHSETPDETRTEAADAADQAKEHADFSADDATASEADAAPTGTTDEDASAPEKKPDSL